MGDNYITIDTEVCGLHGIVTLIQWAQGNGEIHLFDVWHHTPEEILELIEFFAYNPDGLLMFNATFDFFHLYKLWTICRLLPDCNTELEDQIENVANIEPLARDYHLCLKPQKCMDIFLHARKTSYQSVMDRKDVRIKKIPASLAPALARELERRVPLKDIYFARRKDVHAPKWQVVDRKNEETDWKDIVVKFAPSSALKALAVDALGIDPKDILKYGDIEVNRRFWPVELGFAPFAAAVRYGDPSLLTDKQRKAMKLGGKWKGAWPDYIKWHIKHWAYYEPARKYAALDVEYTRKLYQYFGNPAFDDDDSILAFMIAAARWRGFKVNLPAIKELKESVKARRYIVVGSTKYKIPTAPNDVKRYVMENLSETERLVIQDSSKRAVLEKIAKFTIPCSSCSKDTYCEKCNNTGRVKHPAASRAQQVLDARKGNKEIELYDKLLLAGRFHASFKIIGALSSRMSGADKLNPQGIKRTKEVRRCFTLAWPDYQLCMPDNVWILTSQGPKQIKDLVNKSFIAIVNGEKYNSIGFSYVGQKEVFEIETENGHKIQATANHPFLINYYSNYSTTGYNEGINQWIELKNIKIGDHIYLHNHKYIEWDGSGNWNEGYILGWMYGDGCFYKREKGNSIRNELPIHPDDHCVLNKILSCFDECPNIRYDEKRNCYRISSKEIEKLRIEYGIDTRKIINNHIESASSEFLSGFLSGIFDADGSANTKQIGIRLSQSNLHRLEVIQRILLRFNINSSIKKIREAQRNIKIANNIGNMNTAYELIIRKENVKTFKERINFCNQYKRQKIIESLSKYTIYRRLVKERFIEKVKSIKNIGIKDVYDTYVKDANCFDANGFMAHNCGGKSCRSN